MNCLDAVNFFFSLLHLLWLQDRLEYSRGSVWMFKGANPQAHRWNRAWALVQMTMTVMSVRWGSCFLTITRSSQWHHKCIFFQKSEMSAVSTLLWYNFSHQILSLCFPAPPKLSFLCCISLCFLATLALYYSSLNLEASPPLSVFPPHNCSCDLEDSHSYCCCCHSSRLFIWK